MWETYRMLGQQREDELLGEAARLHRLSLRARRPGRVRHASSSAARAIRRTTGEVVGPVASMTRRLPVRAWFLAVSVALLLCAFAASLSVAAVTGDRHPPTAPRVAGPRTTTKLTATYRFSARDNITPARQLRFRCAFDSPTLKACPRLDRTQLAVGQHVLRVQALDRAGNESGTTVVHVLVEPALAAAHVLASVAVTDAGLMTFAADGSLWVNRTSDSQTGTVSRIDPAGNQVTATVKVSQPGAETGGGCDIAFGLGSVWVVNYAANSVSRIDPTTNAVLATISTETGTGSQPCGLAITPQYVFVAKHEPVGSVVKIDPSTNRMADEIPVGMASPVGGPPFIVTADGSVWGNGPGAVLRLDPVTDKVLAKIEPCRGNGGFKMATDGVALWASNCDTGLGGISRVDPATNTIRTVLPASALAAYITRSRVVPLGVALTFGGGTLWAAGQCGSSVCVLGVDPVSNAIVKAWTLPLTAGGGLAYGDGSLWVAGGNSVLRIDPGS
jgi:YVTN family beta-propeller protein